MSVQRTEDNPVNILIIEAYSDANVGSCALVENSLKILKSKFPGAKVRIIAQYPKAFIDRYGVDSSADIFIYPAKQSKVRKIWWLLKIGVWMFLILLLIILIPRNMMKTGISRTFMQRLEPMIWSDLIVSVGAERLNDKYYKSGPFSLYALLVGRLLEKKVVIFPATIGPFFFKWTVALTKRVLPELNLIFTRDKASTDNLQNLFQVPPKKIISTVDVAVLQEQSSKKEAYQLIGASPDDFLVGISVLKWGYFKNSVDTPYSNFEAYVCEMALTADTLIDKYNVTVVFYPTNFRVHGCSDDDLAVAHKIHNLMDHRDNVIIITELPTPQQMQAMLSCSEINITTRMHACILSTNGFVPTISVNYLMKLREYMDSLGLSDFSIEIEEFCADRAISAFAKMWPEREKWRSHLEKKISERKLTLWKSMEALYDLFS